MALKNDHPNNGIYERVKLILFMERNNIKKGKYNSNAWKIFIDSINLTAKKKKQIIKTCQATLCGSTKTDINFYLPHYFFNAGTSNHQFYKALKMCDKLFPNMLSHNFQQPPLPYKPMPPIKVNVPKFLIGLISCGSQDVCW